MDGCEGPDTVLTLPVIVPETNKEVTFKVLALMVFAKTFVVWRAFDA
jgi:hypothetical protein